MSTGRKKKRQLPSPEELQNLPPDGGDSYNRLVFEKSPYLLQHATNPVDWYPWGNEALERSRTEGKPLFVSIGYSTCRWCHVMERESFENEEVAEILNSHFVPIKVDREERPDLDQLYMTACQAFTGSGGWPLNVVTTPEGKPFFAATYLPPRGRNGRRGLIELLQHINRLWQSERERLEEAGEEMAEALRRQTPRKGDGTPAEKTLLDGRQELRDDYDIEHGGFGRAPKFPVPHNLMFLLRCWLRFRRPADLEMVEHSLLSMLMGGIHDHIGFGFHRYSTDRRWLVPHFEKMLYDQALLSLACTELYQATGDERFQRSARNTLDYAMRDLRAPDGGFCAGRDAESDGREGKFYVWTLEEWKDVLGESDGELWADIFNIKRDGNYLDESTGHKTGANIPHLEEPFERIAREHDMTPKELQEKWEKARRKLLRARSRRNPPTGTKRCCAHGTVS